MTKVLSKRERIILYVTLGVIIFAIGFNFLFTPILTKNEDLNKEIELTQTKLKKYLRLLSQKDYLQNKYNEFSGHLKDSLTRDFDTYLGVLSELENLTKAANIRIIDIRPQAPKSLALYKEIIVDLRTEGTMADYLKFIYTVENSLSLLRIKKFQLNAKANTSLLEGSFSISKFFD